MCFRDKATLCVSGITPCVPGMKGAYGLCENMMKPPARDAFRCRISTTVCDARERCGANGADERIDPPMTEPAGGTFSFTSVRFFDSSVRLCARGKPRPRVSTCRPRVYVLCACARARVRVCVCVRARAHRRRAKQDLPLGKMEGEGTRVLAMGGRAKQDLPLGKMEDEVANEDQVDLRSQCNAAARTR